MTTGAFLEEVPVRYLEWIREKQCGKKIRFHGPLPARNYATVLEWVNPGIPQLTGMTAYECPWCAFWHLGHDVALAHARPAGSGDTDPLAPEDRVRARRILRRRRRDIREANTVQAEPSGDESERRA